MEVNACVFLQEHKCRSFTTHQPSICPPIHFIYLLTPALTWVCCSLWEFKLPTVVNSRSPAKEMWSCGCAFIGTWWHFVLDGWHPLVRASKSWAGDPWLMSPLAPSDTPRAATASLMKESGNVAPSLASPLHIFFSRGSFSQWTH